jgi:hypothetical protein
MKHPDHGVGRIESRDHIDQSTAPVTIHRFGDALEQHRVGTAFRGLLARDSGG